MVGGARMSLQICGFNSVWFHGVIISFFFKKLPAHTPTF